MSKLLTDVNFFYETGLISKKDYQQQCSKLKGRGKKEAVNCLSLFCFLKGLTNKKGDESEIRGIDVEVLIKGGKMNEYWGKVGRGVVGRERERKVL